MRAVVLISLVLILVIAPACIGDDDDTPGATAESTSTEAESDGERPVATSTATTQDTSESTSTAAATTTMEPTATSTTPPPPTQTPTPAPTATPEPMDLVVTQFGFGQDPDGRSVGWGFIVENPNTEQAVERNEYRVAFLDSNGTVLDTDSGRILLIFPGERMVVGGGAFLDEGVRVASIDVQVRTGMPVATESATGPTSQNVTYLPDRFGPKVSAVIENPYPEILNDLYMGAAAFDADGNIIGGGFTFLDVLPGSGHAGVTVRITASAEPVTVDASARVSNLTSRTEVNPDTDLVIEKMGFGVEPGETRLGWAAILRNPNPTGAVTRSTYQVSFFDAEGRVVAEDSGSIAFTFPGATTAIGSYFVSFPEGFSVASVEVAVLTGDIQESDLTQQITTEQAAFVPSQFSQKVTGFVRNPFDTDLSDLYAIAVAYDEGGNIIGGGFTFVDFVLAGNQAAVDVSVTVSQEPAAVELYAYPSNLTSFQP